MEYWDKEAGEGHGDNRRLKGDSFGPNGNVRIIPKSDYNGTKITAVGITDATITPGWIFDHVSIINTGNTTLIFCIDKSATDTPNTKLIYLPPGAPYNMSLSGEVLHYTSDSAGGEFVYVLGKAVTQ